MPLKNPYRTLAIQAARAADDKKGLDIVVLDIHTASDIADFVVIVSAEASSHMNAIEYAIEAALKAYGYRPVRRDGRPRDRWMALDYGALFVHVMLTEAREFYRLEQLWESAKKIKWARR
jgi:ribosome-associated protein